MSRASTRGVPVALTELRSAEWLRLTFGLFWRSLVWAIVASLLGTAVAFAVAFGLTWAMGSALDPQAYRRIAVPLTLLIGMGVGFLAFGSYARWILSARYGSLRLVVVRSQEAERVVDAV